MSVRRSISFSSDAWLTSLRWTAEASLFIQLYDAIISNPEQVGHGRNGFYFGENGEVTWYDLSKAIAKSLVKRGLIQSDEPSTFTPEELVKYFGSEVRCLLQFCLNRSQMITTVHWEPVWEQLSRAESTLQISWMGSKAHYTRSS